MLQNSNFRLPRGHRFRPKSDLTVMAPNHGGKSLGSILGPMGYHWVQKMGQNRRKLPCPKIRIVDYPAVIDFGQNPTLGLWRQITMGPRDHIEANGVPLGPKNGSKPWKIRLPQNSNFLQPRGHRLRPKSDLTVMAPNHGGETLGSILGQWGPIGSKKWVKTVKITMPQNSNFRLPHGHQFWQKSDLTVMAPNHGGDPLVSILGPIGSHWVPKMGQNRKQLPCSKIRIFDYPAVIDFSQNPT